MCNPRSAYYTALCKRIDVDLNGAGLGDLLVCAAKSFVKGLTLPQDEQVLVSPLIAAPHLGQPLLWKLTRTGVDCMLILWEIASFTDMV